MFDKDEFLAVPLAELIIRCQPQPVLEPQHVIPQNARSTCVDTLPDGFLSDS
jgi:hypothetical protein